MDVHYPVYGHLFNALVDITKVNLSMEGMANFGFFGPRASRIMAAGGFVLAYYCPGMEYYFGRNRLNLVYFTDVQQGIKEAKFYLEYPEARQEWRERVS